MVGHPGAGFGAAVGVVFFLFYAGFVLVGLIGWIVFLVAAWRLMRAHESLADSARAALELLAIRQSPRE
jgi:hypothetical protein